MERIDENIVGNVRLIETATDAVSIVLDHLEDVVPNVSSLHFHEFPIFPEFFKHVESVANEHLVRWGILDHTMGAPLMTPISVSIVASVCVVFFVCVVMFFTRKLRTSAPELMRPKTCLHFKDFM